MGLCELTEQRHARSHVRQAAERFLHTDRIRPCNCPGPRCSADLKHPEGVS